MSSFGSYEVVEELHRTPFGYVCTARRAGNGGNGHQGEFVIKVFEAPDTDGDGLPGPIVNGTEHFVGRARLQQKLSERPTRHWAPIHELGEVGDKPFYVTDYYPRSAQKLILGRVNLGPAALHEIMDSVVRGLRELQQVCNQSHGCLKPTNVLIGGAGEVSGAKIVLTDPACGGAPGETEHGGDLHALGALIYQLVFHRPFHSTAWPIQPSDEWESLGKFAVGWRELCNDLLNPDPSKRADMPTVDRSLAALHPHGISVKQIKHLPTAAARKVPVKTIAACLILLTFVAAGGGGFLYYKQAASYSRMRQARAAWIDPLWNDKKKLNQYASLGAAIVTQSDWDAVQLPDRPRSAADFSLSAIKRSQNAEAAADQVHRRLLEAYDKSAGPLRDLQQSYDREGYTQAAAHLGSTLAAHAPDDAHLINAIDARIALAEKLTGSRPGMSAATASILDGFTRAGDRDLQAFATVLRAEYRKQCVLSADGWTGGEQFDQLARQIASVQNWPKGYDAERLHREEKLDPGHVQLPDVQRWLSVVNQYAWVGPTDAQRQTTGKLTAQLAGASDSARADLLRFLTVESSQVRTLEQERATIQKQIDQLGAAQFVRKDLPSAFDAQAKKLNKQITLLPSRYQYQPGDLATWFGQIQGQHFNTAAAQEAWSRWMKDRTPANIDAAWKSQTSALAKTLTDLETKTFVPPDTLQLEPWAAPVRKAADEAAARAIGQIPPGATELPADQLARVKNDFSAWCDEAAKLEQEQARLQHTMINAAVIEQHDARWNAAGNDRDFWKTQVETGPFAQIMDPELQRIARIRAILEESSQDKLIEASRASKRPEVTLAVWSRLGALQKWSHRGPLTPAEIESWTDLLVRVNAASEKMLPVPRKAVEKQVARSGQEMWLAAVNGDSPELLEAATAAMARLQLTPETAGLSPLQRFDAALAAAVRSNSADISSQLADLPEWDRAALQQLAGHADIAEATLKNRRYLWSAGETDRKTKWQNSRLNPADQLAKADALIEDYQPQAAKAALQGLSGPRVEETRSKIEKLEADAPSQLRQAKAHSAKGDYRMAIRGYQDAAQGGSTEAMLDLARMYRTGTDGAMRSPRLALTFYRRAATSGNANAMAEVAREADSPAVAAWLNDAAKAGNMDAMAVLAQIALQNQDLDRASKMLAEAQTLDPDKKEWRLASLMRQLGSLYDDKRDPDDARKWYQAGADRGDTDARDRLRR